MFLTPWLLGLIGIAAIPMFVSLYISFTDYSAGTPLGDAKWVGLANYRRMFSDDPRFWNAVRVTAVFAAFAVPLKLALALGAAMLLNRPRAAVGTLRSLFYLPSLLGGSVAIAIVCQALFSRSGPVNALLAMVGIEGRPWVNDPDFALGTLILLAVWQFGAPMVIFLAGLKQIPGDYYEAAELDGAGWWHRFAKVTVPLLSPVIFFNLVLETINGFQGFTGAYIVSGGNGGPLDSTLVYTLYLYTKGFGDFEMGYASAMAWVFLVAVGLLTAIFFATGRLWVHYGDERDR
jgi:multiple sugar transport system permease protein